MKKILIKIIKFYQREISPTISQKGTACKYRPTCSQYAIEAIEKYGSIKGIFMAIWRIIRCNPFSNGGYDPVK